jgi:alanine dehydrogenase
MSHWHLLKLFTDGIAVQVEEPVGAKNSSGRHNEEYTSARTRLCDQKADPWIKQDLVGKIPTILLVIF